MHTKKYIFSFFLLIFIFQGICFKAQSYDELQNKYENTEENNEKALSLINKFIVKAKKENNYEKLADGYEDAIYYSSDCKKKLLYADSSIISAKKSFNNDLISRAYLGKGIIYYYNLKKYKDALSNYLKAYSYAKKGKDTYQKNKIVYHIGVVKCYLGYYKDALGLFSECIDYFEPKTTGDYHPNEIYNHQKGYLNSLHMTIVCYRYLGEYQKVDSLIHTGLDFINLHKLNKFKLEYHYILKCKGISQYNENKFNSAIQTFEHVLPVLEEYNDFSWASVVDFYIGKSYIGLHQEEKAVMQFKKVDSIFQKYNFILPELRENYEFLIRYYKKNNVPKQELHYTKILLRADSILSRDFTILSSRIHREYDTQNLVDIQSKLENQNKWGIGMIFLLFTLTVVLIYGIKKYYRKEKEIKSKYKTIEHNIQQWFEQKSNKITYENLSSQSKSTMSEEIYKDLQLQLENFEKTKKFLEKGITLNKLAVLFDTNSTYLSQFINETKGMNFNKYLGTLRISYITQLMYENEKYLNYTIQGLSDECGIASRQNFSDLFQEINGFRPTDFIKKRKKDLEDSKTSPDQSE